MESSTTIIGSPAVNQLEIVSKSLHARNEGGDPLGGPLVSEACKHVAAAVPLLDTKVTSDEIPIAVEVGPIGQMCGRWVKLFCQHCGHVRRVYEACGDRLSCKWCRLTWIHETQRRFEPVLAEMFKRGRCRFITLTVKNGFDLRERLTHIRKAWRKLSQRVFWKRSVAIGIRSLELTFNPASGWHVHYHIFACGEYIKQRELSDAWLDITGDSWIVDIRAAGDTVKAKKELIKYTLKDAKIPAERLDEVRRVLRGARLVELIGANKDLRKQMRGKLRDTHAPECESCGSNVWVADVPLAWWTRATVVSTGPPATPRVPTLVTLTLFGEGCLYGG